MIINKNIWTFIIVIGFLFTFKSSFGQYGNLKFDKDKQQRISLTEFYHRVDRATKLLQTKELSAISDKDHINIMMCLNTIFTFKSTLSGTDKRFNNARCKKLEIVADEINYQHNIMKVYPQWVHNRGMGQYYPKLKMELYGTPNLYATFSVSK